MVEKKYQVTLLCADGKYKPVSSIVTLKQEKDEDLSKDKLTRKTLQKRGIEKICFSRGWGAKDLQRYNYTKVKYRLYDKQKIEQENKERYERIKEEKYASGEWQRPKKEKKD